MERDFAAYLFTLLCPLFTSGASFSIAHEYSVRKVNTFTVKSGSLRLEVIADFKSEWDIGYYDRCLRMAKQMWRLANNADEIVRAATTVGGINIGDCNE